MNRPICKSGHAEDMDNYTTLQLTSSKQGDKESSTDTRIVGLKNTDEVNCTNDSTIESDV